MVTESTLSDHQFQQALEAVEAENVSPIEKAEMLMEIAMGLQQKPKSPKQLYDAVDLYDRAIALCQDSGAELVARIRARKGTALQAIPDGGPDFLLKAEAEFESALSLLEESGKPEELAEINLNLGLVVQGLAGLNRAKITDAIAAYQRALRTFSREAYPTEYAILHNNLATAYLSIPMTDERAKMREALAVQSFEEALKIVTIEEQPSEYAMLQNNLGNALQYVSSSHGVENNLRALEAYDEALKVRTATDTPFEYANTICNKANCLRNLPDSVEDPESGNRENLTKARDMYREAKIIFEQFGDPGRISIIDEVLAEVDQDLGIGEAGSREGKGFGESRI
ncbi:MAG: hypothetical protein RLT87_11215 [Gammaproteobacteria bacterium]